MRAAAWLALLAVSAAGQQPGALMQAISDEIGRAGRLKIAGLDPPYFIECSVDDAWNFSAAASLGGLVSLEENRFRLPRVRVRVGDYKFDNGNYAFSDYYSGTRFDAGRLPIDDDVTALRRQFWLAIDRAYKTAVEAIASKRAALRNVSQAEQLPDLARAEPLKIRLSRPRQAVDRAAWGARLRSLSAVFAAYPELTSSSVDLEWIQSDSYVVNNEGTAVSIPDRVAFLRLRASALAGDGMRLREARVLHASDAAALPGDETVRGLIREMASGLAVSARAVPGESCAGPVLFEGEAAAQLFAEVLGGNLAVTRRPVSPPGRPVPVAAGDLEGRLGARVLPEWMDAIDDPNLEEFDGRALMGHYAADMEGVAPLRVALVENGILKAFLLTRQPVRGFEGSNGRARLPGNFGANRARLSNLLIRAGKTEPAAGLKGRLTSLCKERNRPYGIIVRRMDFPSSAGLEELRQLLSDFQGGAAGRPVSLPLRLARVYPDGREEAVRGLRFRGLTARSLRDIVAASAETYQFDFLDNGAPFAVMGGGSFVCASSVVAPAVLIDDLELEPLREGAPRPPLAPAPVLEVR